MTEVTREDYNLLNFTTEILSDTEYKKLYAKANLQLQAITHYRPKKKTIPAWEEELFKEALATQITFLKENPEMVNFTHSKASERLGAYSVGYSANTASFNAHTGVSKAAITIIKQTNLWKVNVKY